MQSSFSNPFGLSQTALDECAREPIHIPGSIQPYGALLVMNPANLTVLQTSINTVDILGYEPAQILGRQLDALLGPQGAATVARAAGGAPVGRVQPLSLDVVVRDVPASLLGLLHRQAELLLLELLPEPQRDELAPATPEGLGQQHVASAGLEVARRLSQISGDLDLETPLSVFCQHVAAQVRALTGYDRVMVYQFDVVGNGQVVAEARDERIEPFLGLCYPAADIPPQARLLYLRSRVRALGDIYYQPAPILPRQNPLTGADTDMSLCLLRSFSPVHLEYLHNMGVRATLTISIIEQGRLWGLIACHHYQPKWPTQPMRSACDVLSELISMQLVLRAHYLHTRGMARAQQVQYELIRRLAANGDWFAAVAGAKDDLLEVVAADGVAVCRDDAIVVLGSAPDPASIRSVLTWLQTTVPAKVLITDSLGALNPSFAALAPHASGLIAMEVARAQGCYLLWFRPERVQTVTWGGNPAEKLLVSEGIARLHPRASFAAWQTEMRGKSQPWPAEAAALAESMRMVLVDILLDLLSNRYAMTSLDLLRIRRAVEVTGEPIVIADTQGRPLFMNRAFTQMLGFDEAAVAGLASLGALVADPAQAAASEAGARSLSGHWEGELDLVATGGERIPVALRIDRIDDAQGRPTGQIRLYIDQRARRRAEEERRRLDEQLLQTQKLESLGVLAGGIAHDFNNLLTAMLGHANLALLELSPESPARENIAQIETAAMRAADLARQMLAYSGRGHLQVQPLDLNQLVVEMAHLLQTAVASRAVLKFNLGAQLPPLQADATQLRQVVMNLIMNASDAIGEHSGVITITTGAALADAAFLASFTTAESLPEGTYVSLEISDTGSGMDEATMARIFDPFFTTKFAGRGLGLAAVHGIIRGHKAGIRVYSQQGVGSTFRILLPAIAGAPAQASERPSVAKIGSGELVLVVDDDPSVRDFLRRVLERSGFQVLLAADGRAGLALFAERQEEVRLVLLDLTMPHMSGADTFQALRRLRPDLRVVLCSGYSEEEATASFAGRGLAGFVQKPFRVAELQDVIGRVLAL